MTEPVVVQPVLMKDVGDCGICCLAMLLGVEYAAIVQAIPKRNRKKAQSDGLTIIQMCNVAKVFLTQLEYHDEPEEDAVGILFLERTVGEDAHAVMYMKGVLFHPGDGTIWTDMDAYLKRYNWKMEGFLWRK